MESSIRPDQSAYEALPLQNLLRNGDIISQRQFTELILQQDQVESLTLLTMAYMTPTGSGGSVARIHNHLIHLANQGAAIHIGIDNNYAHHIAPHSDFPNFVAPIFMNRNEVNSEKLKKVLLYEELEHHPNIDLVYHGRNEARIPLRKFDHRKILQVKGSKTQDFAVIYGFNLDETIDNDVDSGVYITNPEALAWLDDQKDKRYDSQPVKAFFEDFEFTTRETVRKGDILANNTISDVIEGAEKTLLFCGQFIPTGRHLDQLVKAADRKVEVVIVSNKPSTSRQPLYIPARTLAERQLAGIINRKRNFHLLTPDDPNIFIHMKAIIADIDNPQNARAITGTDNMASPTLGLTKSREILVELLRYNHIGNLYQYMAQNVFPDVNQS